MITAETVAHIRRLFYAEHWKIGTIAQELGLHRDTVRTALQTDRFNRAKILRPSLTDPYIDFIKETLEKYPRLRTTRIYEMIRDRGYTGSVVILRRVVARLRPVHREAFLRLRTFPGEQGQVDWAHFGAVAIGRARRRLSCFVLTLSYSRALYLEFFFDQTLENFLRGHVRAFNSWSGCPRVILSDNLKSAVLERHGDAVHFHPRLIELCAHYHFATRPCQVARGNQKGRVERTIQYIRHSFFAARRASPPWRTSTVKRFCGATKSLIDVPGPETSPAPLSKSSKKRKNLDCFHCRCIPSIPIWWYRFDRARPSMSVLISTTTRFHTRPWVEHSLWQHHRTLYAFSMVQPKSPDTDAPTTAMTPSWIRRIKKHCYKRNVKPSALLLEAVLLNRYLKAKP